jgi:hypothetical protein
MLYRTQRSRASAYMLAASLCALGAAGCGGTSLEIRFYGDDTCMVNGELVDQKRLVHHLRQMQDYNSRLDLKRAIVRLPWNGTDEQCKRMESLARSSLAALAPYGDVDCRRAENPYAAFAKSIVPYAVVGGVGYLLVRAFKRRKTRKRPR